MAKKRKLTDNMRRVLFNLIDGNPVSQHCRTQSDHGGLQLTLRSMRKAGLLTSDYELTDAGRAAAKELTAPPR